MLLLSDKRMFGIIGLIVVWVAIYKRYKGRDDYYIAAVVEYEPVEYKPADDMIAENVANYELIISNASHYDVDIIIFPECGLTGINIPQVRNETKPYLTEIPDPKDSVVPYLSAKYNDKILHRISLAAKSYGVYVVINLPEIAFCSIVTDLDCPDDGAYYYNTNIVFDRNGAIIAKYRKLNLFTEWAFNRPKEEEINVVSGSFVADFGVTFAMFTCFDIMFENPTVRISQLADDVHIIYTTAWMSQYPFLTAITTHSMWSYSRKRTMLSANYNNVSGALTGSGIYLANGMIPVASIDRSDNKILISSVPKRFFPASDNNHPLYDIFDLTDKIPLQPRVILLPETNSQPSSLVNKSMKFYFARELYKFHSRSLEKTTDDVVQTASFAYENPDGFHCEIKMIYNNKENQTITISNDGNNNNNNNNDNNSNNNNNNNNNNYKLLGGSCQQNLTMTIGHMEACGLSLYPNENETNVSLISLPNKTNLNVTFMKIIVKSNYSTFFSFPITLTTELGPLNVNDFTYTEFQHRTEIDGRTWFEFEMQLTKPIENLLTFAIYRIQANSYN